MAQDFGNLSLIGVSGAGGGAEDIFEIQMDTSGGSGMVTLDAAASYNEGDILIVSSSDPPGGGYIFLAMGDNIDGDMNYPLGPSEVLILRVANSTTFNILGAAPRLSDTVLATGGDTVTLPDHALWPEGTCYLVVFNSGSGVVTVEPAVGSSITGGDQTISEVYQGMVFRRTSSGWEPYTQTATLPEPAATTLPTIAINSGALHCWFGRSDPFLDLVGSADFARNGGQTDIPPIPLCVEGLIESNPEPAAFAGPLTGATACALSRSGSDRSFAWLFRLSADDGHSDSVLLRLGVTTKGLCTIRAQSSVLVDDPTTWPTGTTTLFTQAAAVDQWVLLIGWWELGANTLRLYWSIAGGAEGTANHTKTDTPAAGMDQIQLGYSNLYSASVFHGFLAIWGDSTAADIRSQLYAALGWTP